MKQPKIKKETKHLVKCFMSDSQYKKLCVMANNMNVHRSEYIRNLIDILYLAENTDSIEKGEIVELGGYGIQFNPEFLSDFAFRLETAFKGFNFEDIEQNIIIKPNTRKDKRTSLDDNEPNT
jgi:hypothetical protein